MATKQTKTATPKATQEQQPKTGNVFKAKYREHYLTTTNKAGRIKIDNGDATATSLREKTLDEVYKLAAKETREALGALRERYQHLNAGMQRMNLGNKIRGAQARKAREAQAKAKKTA